LSLQETQFARDSLTELTYGRQVLFAGLALLLFVSLVPYTEISSDLATSVDGFVDYLKSLWTGTGGAA
jgi:hypothetical protein